MAGDAIRQSMADMLDGFSDAVRTHPLFLTMGWTDLIARWRPERDAKFEESVYGLLFKSWLLGMRHAAEGRSGEGDFADLTLSFDLPYEDAVRFAGARTAVAPRVFRKLSDDMKSHAFTLARLTQLDLVKIAHEIYKQEWRTSGASLDRFVQEMDEAFGEKVGIGGYYELVYRTNIQKDYNAGKAMEMAANPPPYLEFIGIDDERQTDICHACSGVVLPYGDPWWATHWPPLHFNCRSTVREVSTDEAKERGLLDGSHDFASQTKGTDVDKGWGLHPARNDSFWPPTSSMYDRIIKAGIQDELNAVAGGTTASDFSRPKPGYTSEAVTRGGVRWAPGTATPDIDAARILAEQGGWHVELGQQGVLLNGIEKAAMGSAEGSAVEDAVRQAVGKAKTLVLSMDSAAARHLARLPKEERARLFGGLRQALLIVDGVLIQLSSADLTASCDELAMLI